MKKLITLLLVLCGGISQVSATDWYVAGVSAIVNGSEWVASQDVDKMTDIGDGKYQLVVTGKSLTSNTTYQYKITDGTNWYGWGDSKSENAYFKPHVTGIYTITYIFDSNTNNVWEAEAVLTDCAGIYLHCNNAWTDNALYKFTPSDGTFILDVDLSNISEFFYFRFHVSEDDNDFGCYDTNTALNGGIWTGYEINLNDGAFWKATGYDRNFYLPLDTKPCAKLHLSLRIVNKKVIMDMLCYESVTTNSSGYRTFVNYYPLTMPSSTAYYAKDNGNGSATAYAITNPPASTPMLIKGDPSTTYYFAVASSGTALENTNAFQAGDGSAVAKNAGGKYNYLLNGATFKAANGKNKVAEGKAYLQLSQEATGASRILIFDEDGEATGIRLVDYEQQTGDDCYNLQGIKVASPTKGVYLRNGKKFIVK